MLNSVAKLSQNILGHIIRILSDEIDPYPFRANKPRNLFDLIDQNFGSPLKQQMSFIKEKHELGFVWVSNFWKLLKQLAQQPEQEC